MNLLQALLTTYNRALENHLVDVVQDETKASILPLYHSNKRSTSGEDILEITLDEDGEFLTGRFLPKDAYVIYPVTQSSLIKTGNPAPHPLCDKVIYLSKPLPGITAKLADAWYEKYTLYMNQLGQIKDFSEHHPNPDFNVIYQYIVKTDIMQDVIGVIKNSRAGKDYRLEEDKLIWTEVVNKKEKEKSMNLSSIFITFAIEHLTGSISVTQNQEIHQFYIDYVMEQLKDKPKDFCDITGQKMYCVSSHRGLLGNAKLISISNNKDYYKGTVFSTGEEVIHIGYETSQKIHNMLKYLLDTNSFNRHIGGNTYIVSWLVQDLQKGGAPFSTDAADEDPFAPEDDGLDDVKEQPVNLLGNPRSHDLISYFTGAKAIGEEAGDSNFCLLILEKISAGRISVKYFREFPATDILQRVKSWYASIKWLKWSKIEKRMQWWYPSIFTLVNFLYGTEDDGKLNCKQDAVKKQALGRLIPCIVEGKRLPRDMQVKAFYQLLNRQSYKKCWLRAISLGCIIFKKCYWDSGKWNREYPSLTDKGVINCMDKRSFAYGRLLAAYEKLEEDALVDKQIKQSEKTEKATRVTNAERFWTSMIQRPLQTAALLETRTKYYRNSLGQKNKGRSVFYAKLFTQLYNEIRAYEVDSMSGTKSANEDFILGYYYQQQQFYTPKDIEK